MWNRQGFAGNFLTAVQQDVEIECAWRVRIRALASIGEFDRLQCGQQFLRGQLRVDAGHCVDEIVTACVERGGAEQALLPGQTGFWQAAQLPQCALDIAARVA